MKELEDRETERGLYHIIEIKDFMLDANNLTHIHIH